MNHRNRSKQRLKPFASNAGMQYQNDDDTANDRLEISLIGPIELTPDLKRPMPVDYIPSPHSVLTGRGKFCSEATGSKHLRVMASKFLDQYSKADTKHAKSAVVSKIIEIIKKNCPSGGAFVKLEEGRWWEVDKSAARDKVGHVLRNLLHDKYRSSSKSKAKTRRLRLSKEGQYKNNMDIDDTLSHSSSESTPHLSLSGAEGTGSEDPSSNHQTAAMEGFTTFPAAALPAQGYNAAVAMPGNPFLGNGTTFHGLPVNSGPAAGVSHFPPSFLGSQVPPMTNLARAHTWPLVVQNRSSGPMAPQLRSFSQNSNESPPMPSFRDGANKPVFGGKQSWRQPPPFSSSTNNMNSMMGSGFLEEVLEIEEGGDSAPIDESDLSSIFD
jgi:hypothetical protein